MDQTAVYANVYPTAGDRISKSVGKSWEARHAKLKAKAKAETVGDGSRTGAAPTWPTGILNGGEVEMG